MAYVHTSKPYSNHWAKAKQAVELALDNNFEDPNFNFGKNSNENWSLNKFVTERPFTILFDGSFYEKLEGDPRRQHYALQDNQTIYHPDSLKLVWTQADASIPLISKCELHFILAEHAANSGDNELALNQAKNAVNANFQMMTLEDSENYIDNINLGDNPLKSIIEEAYKSFYGYNFLQTWVNYRRTGYPVIQESDSQTMNSFNPSGTVPGRYMYVESEIISNRSNVEAAQANQGGDLLDNSLWAFK